MNQVVTEFIEQWLEENEPPGLRQVVSDRTPSPPSPASQGEPTPPAKDEKLSTTKSKRGNKKGTTIP